MRKAARVIVAAVGAAAMSAAGAANLVVNPDFDRGLDGWTADTSRGGTAALASLSGWPTRPSARLFGDRTTPAMYLYSSCMAVDGGTPVDLFVNLVAWSGLGAFGIVPYADADCATALDPIVSDDVRYSGFMLSLKDVALPAGTRSAKVVLIAHGGDDGAQPDVAFDHIQFGPAGTVSHLINLNQEGLTGTWYNPETSGQGIQLDINQEDSMSNGSLFGAWFTYGDDAGGTSSQRWYSIMSAFSGDTRLVAVNIRVNAGGNFAAPPQTTSAYAGQGWVSFDSCETGSFQYAMNDGRTGMIPLRRLLPNINCVDDGAPGNPPGDVGLSGAWYDPASSGQGVLVDVNPASSQVFLGWYTYPERGADGDGLRWFSGEGAYDGSRTMDLTLYASQNGTFDAGSNAVLTRPVGTATLSYADCWHATLDYRFQGGELEGKHGSIALTRVDLPPASCTPAGP